MERTFNRRRRFRSDTLTLRNIHEPGIDSLVYTWCIAMTESQRIYKELKQDIVTCKLAPGLSLSESEMCARYSASRTPVREACRRLGDESLMQMIPFRGYSITPLTIEEYRNLRELQSVVEPAVAALAAERATPEQLREISGWATYEYQVGERNSYSTFLEWNKNFHISIAAASRNQSLIQIVTNAQTRLMRYYYLVIVMDSYGPQLVAEHQELVRALRSGNADLARARASDHLENTVKRSMRVDLQAVNLSTDSPMNTDYSDWLRNPPPLGTKHPKRRGVPKTRKIVKH